MKTYRSLFEAEGFQGKFKPDPDTVKQAIELRKKVNPQKKIRRPPSGAGRRDVGPFEVTRGVSTSNNAVSTQSMRPREKGGALVPAGKTPADTIRARLKDAQKKKMDAVKGKPDAKVNDSAEAAKNSPLAKPPTKTGLARNAEKAAQLSRKKREKIAKAKHEGGVLSGIKSALGGDKFMSTKDHNGDEDPDLIKKKREAQKEFGKNIVKGAKRIGGSALRTAAKGLVDTESLPGSSKAGDVKGPRLGIYKGDD